MDEILLKVNFGKDQQPYIDALIARMEAEGRIITVEKIGMPDEYILYKLLFETHYDVYLFGYRQADMIRHTFANWPRITSL